MDVILHVGAHRAASTSFQRYLAANPAWLAGSRSAVWTPPRTRNGLLAGLAPQPLTPRAERIARRSVGRVRMHLSRLGMARTARLIVSDENMLGAVPACLRDGRLYQEAGSRLARYGAAFGRVDRLVLVVRPQPEWWRSAMAYARSRGRPVPTPDHLARIARSRRGWRDVVTDLACALPEARIIVLPFARTAGRADRLLTAAAGRPAPHAACGLHCNAAPDDGPRFKAAQQAALAEAWQDDLYWLRAGAGGLAEFQDNDAPTPEAMQPPGGDATGGRRHDSQAGHLV